MMLHIIIYRLFVRVKMIYIPQNRSRAIWPTLQDAQFVIERNLKLDTFGSIQ